MYRKQQPMRWCRLRPDRWKKSRSHQQTRWKTRSVRDYDGETFRWRWLTCLRSFDTRSWSDTGTSRASRILTELRSSHGFGFEGRRTTA
jgi:hypothetical protein